MPLSQPAVRRCVRVWRRRPVLTITVVCTLSVALALATTLLAVTDTAARRALIYPNGPALMQVVDAAPGPGSEGRAIPITGFEEWRRTTAAFRRIAAFSPLEQEIQTTGYSGVEMVTLSSADLLSVLGVPVVAGRGPVRDDERDGCAATLSDRFATARFGGVMPAVGQSIAIGHRTCVVIGVVAERHGFPTGDVAAYVTVPPRVEISRTADGRVGTSIMQVQVLAEAAPGAAQAAMLEEVRTYFPNEPRVLPLREALTASYRHTLRLLGVAAFLLGIVAMLNVAAVLAVVAVQRVREWALKGVLGASRWHLLGEAVGDGLALIVPGVVGALALTLMLLERLRVLGPREVADVALRPELVLFWGLAVLPVCLVSAVPAWIQASRLSVSGHAALQASGAAATESDSARRWLPPLVTTQLAASIVIVGLSLTLAAALVGILTRGRGFSADDAVIVPTSRARGAALDAYVRDILTLERDLTTPGVLASVAADLPVPASPRPFSLVSAGVGGGPVVHAQHGAHRLATVGARYLEVMRTPLVAGRGFAAADDATTPPVVLVSRRFAEARLGGVERAIGAVIDLGHVRGRRATVVGVAEDVRRSAWEDSTLAVVYAPLAQRDLAAPFAANGVERLNLVTRGLDAEAMRTRLRNVPQTLTVGAPWTVRRARLQEVATLAFYVGVSATFAGTALLVVGLGVFAVGAEHVHRRRPELGVRQATGATARVAVRPLSWTFVRWWVAGASLGTPTAILLGTRMAGWDLTNESSTIGIAVASVMVVTVVAIAGVAGPLRRVMREEPADLLRAR